MEDGSSSISSERGERKTCSTCKTGIVLCAIFKAIEDFSHDLDAGRTFRRTGNAYRRDGDFV